MEARFTSRPSSCAGAVGLGDGAEASQVDREEPVEVLQLDVLDPAAIPMQPSSRARRPPSRATCSSTSRAQFLQLRDVSSDGMSQPSAGCLDLLAVGTRASSEPLLPEHPSIARPMPDDRRDERRSQGSTISEIREELAFRTSKTWRRSQGFLLSLRTQQRLPGRILLVGVFCSVTEAYLARAEQRFRRPVSARLEELLRGFVPPKPRPPGR